MYDPEEGPQPTMLAPDLGLLTFRTVRNKFVFNKLPNLSYFVRAAQID